MNLFHLSPEEKRSRAHRYNAFKDKGAIVDGSMHSQFLLSVTSASRPSVNLFHLSLARTRSRAHGYNAFKPLIPGAAQRAA